MPRGRRAVNGNENVVDTDSPSNATPTPPPRSIFPITPTPSKDRDIVKVNNASLTELKNALDDAIKRVRNITLSSLCQSLTLGSHSSSPALTSSNKFTSIPMFASRWAGRAYL
jgi:hypothetical protein